MWSLLSLSSSLVPSTLVLSSPLLRSIYSYNNRHLFGLMSSFRSFFRSGPRSMAMSCALSCFLLLLLGPAIVSSNRVIEMNDRLVEIYPNDPRSFIVKFYAPWCHHCQELEPVWNQVAQHLHSIDSNIIVGRVDCTKYSSVASHFGIRGFPTILYINSQKKVEFKGDRSREDLIDFALRVNGPPIRYLSSCDQLDELIRDDRRVVFINFGPDADQNFTHIAPAQQQHDWFFRSLILCNNFQNGIYVLKSKSFSRKFDYESDGDLAKWIKRQRFPNFVKLTSGNLYMAMHSHKYLVIALVEEFRQSGKFVDTKSKAFHRLVESVALSDHSSQFQDFLFGWTSELVTINSIAIWTIEPIPNLLVLNTSSIQYYLLDDGSSTVDEQGNGPAVTADQATIVHFLNNVIRTPEKLRAYGGDTYFHRLKRVLFDTVTTLVTMYLGNPILTLLLFGLPASFLAIIIYMTCCSDLLDAKDEDYDDEDGPSDEDDDHQKRE